MSVTPYLFFDGNCAEAMRFYERVTGGKLRDLLKYSDSPGGSAPPKIDGDKIMHAYLELPDGAGIMASDDMSDVPYRGMSGFGVALTLQTADEVTRVFNGLSERGDVLMPLQKTFWSPAFGMVTDRFGTLWLVGVATEQ